MKNKLDKNSNMEYKTTDKKKGQIFGNKDIKLSFLSKEYIWSEESGETTCKLTCKLNFSYLEKYFKLNKKVKRTIIDGLLPAYTLYATEPKVYYQKINGKRVQVITEESKKEYNHFDTFTVKATVKVKEGDKFNETIGKMIAEAKAKETAYLKAWRIERRVAEIFSSVAESFYGYAMDMFKYSMDEYNRYMNIGGMNVVKEETN